MLDVELFYQGLAQILVQLNLKNEVTTDRQMLRKILENVQFWQGEGLLFKEVYR